MATAASGKNWEIVPQFLKPRFVEVLGMEALLLSQLEAPYIERYQIGTQHPRSEANVIDCRPLGCHDLTLATDWSRRRQVANLYSFYNLSRDRSSLVHGFFVNILGPFDVVQEHQDDTAVASIVIYLAGKTLLKIHDPGADHQSFEMNPGDAAFIWNGRKSVRPFHEATNLTEDLRVAVAL
jgi:hypothetical protein